MPSNAQMFSDYYANSVVSYWDKQRTEARALLIQERGDQSAYIKSLESAIRAADDDIRGWAQVSDARERATRQSIIQSQRARASSARARSRASRSAISGATSAMTKVESRLAQSSTGQAETASAFERAQGRNIPDDQMILSLTSQMGGVGTDLAKDIAKYSLERGGSADEATRLAASHGIRRTLRETARRNPGAGINENVINGTALNLVGLENTPANRAKIGTYNAMVQAEGDRAARTVQSAPTGSAGAVQVADDLEARGFAPFDFLPEMEVDALKARREKMQADLATAQAQRAEGSDLDAMLQQEMVKRTQGVGQGLQYGGGLLGAMRFGAHNKRRAEAANASLAAAQADSNRLNAMSENERLVYRATAKARQSYNRFGSSMPDGANETLWQLAGQVASMNKRGGFANMDKMVQQVRLLIADTPEGGLNDMSPEQKQVALDQLLEFASMQQLEGWEAPQPAFRGESEAIPGREIEERIDPSARLRNETQRGGTATRIRKQAEDNIIDGLQIRVSPDEFSNMSNEELFSAFEQDTPGSRDSLLLRIESMDTDSALPLLERMQGVVEDAEYLRQRKGRGVKTVRVDPLEISREPTRRLPKGGVTAGSFLANRYRADVNPMSPLREQEAVYLKEQAIRQALGDETGDAPSVFGGKAPMTFSGENIADTVGEVEFAPLDAMFIDSIDDILLSRVGM
tara:strand:+ start:3372 stop:5450 length:2079 start_codon:yes stop_codon:yes gene_type:complete